MYLILVEHAHCSIWVLQKPPVPNGQGGISVNFIILPVHHAYGLHIATFTCFFSPTTLVLLPKWSADVFFDSIPKYVSFYAILPRANMPFFPPMRYRVTSIFLVPSLVHQIVHHPKFPIADFSTVQILSCGAAALPVLLAEKLRSRFPGVNRIGGGGWTLMPLSCQC